jgi:pimeloyl-ACP methyl ester carboxylesterase
MTSAGRELFEGLLRSALAEVTGRHPDYFSHRTLDVQPLERLAQEYARHPLLADVGVDEIIEVVCAGLKYYAEQGVPVRRDCERTDQISSLLIRSALDAHAAARRRIALTAAPTGALATADVLCGLYQLEKTHKGARYVVGRGTDRTLVLISAIGLPLKLWLRLLDDRDLGRRCMVVQGREGLLIEGGMPQPSSLWRDADDINDAVRNEGLRQLDILAWCSGARTAVEIARTLPQHVASLTLVAPTFHGCEAVAKYVSPFEDTLPNVHSMLRQDPERGRMFLHSVVQAAPSWDLAALKHEPEKCVKTVLSLPPQAFARELALPLGTVQDFTNYMERAAIDRSYDIGSALAEVRCPITLITGTHDAVTNTLAARDLLARCASDVTHATVLGAGHHIHLLQYGYFRYVLDCALQRTAPMRTLRLHVEHLAVAR